MITTLSGIAVDKAAARIFHPPCHLAFEGAEIDQGWKCRRIHFVRDRLCDGWRAKERLHISMLQKN